MARRRLGPAPQRLILDAGAVIALSRGDVRARAFVDRALKLGASVEVPVAVVAETLRGPARDAPVHRVLKAIGDVPATTEEVGRLAGELLGRSGSSATVDALVVAQAASSGGAHVLTGDPNDLEALATTLEAVWIQAL
ncbi:MAG: PIN domain-containing protein [Acidobacteriota bacterium]